MCRIVGGVAATVFFAFTQRDLNLPYGRDLPARADRNRGPEILGG